MNKNIKALFEGFSKKIIKIIVTDKDVDFYTKKGLDICLYPRNFNNLPKGTYYREGHEPKKIDKASMFNNILDIQQGFYKSVDCENQEEYWLFSVGSDIQKRNKYIKYLQDIILNGDKCYKGGE